jgi:fatty acid desaturase
MSQADWIRAAIAAGNEFHFNRKNVAFHNAVNLSVLALLLLATAATVSIAPKIPALIFIPAAGFVFGVFFFAMIILVIHEASHGMFLITRARARSSWNRVFGWAVSVPFAINYIQHWEKGHHTHHLHPGEPDDPQVFNFLTGRSLVLMLLKMVCIPGYVFVWNPSRQYRSGRWLGPASVAFWCAAAWFTWTFVSWTVAPALLLGLQVLGALNQLKGSLEHGGGIAHEENRNLRSRTSFFPLRWLIMPLNISLHFEHHLNYCVPWYDLHRYHRAILPLVPKLVAAELVHHSAWEQLMGRRGELSTAARALTHRP